MARRSALSASGGRVGSPQGWGILCPLMTRLAPNCFATMLIVVTNATERPSFSMALAIADPLRVSEPQVETSMTALIPSVFMSEAISLPILVMTEINPRAPDVT